MVRPSRLRANLVAAALLGAALLTGPALADPCKAIPDKGPMPNFLSPGKIFAGPVVYVGDGDSLCVDVGSNSQVENWGKVQPIHPGESWVEIRLADFYAPELSEPGGQAAKAALERIAWHKPIVCTVDHQSYDRVVAYCTDAFGVSLGALLRAAGVKEGGRGR